MLSYKVRMTVVGGLLWLAPECCSWVFMSRGSTGRSFIRPKLNDPYVPSVWPKPINSFSVCPAEAPKAKSSTPRWDMPTESFDDCAMCWSLSISMLQVVWPCPYQQSLLLHAYHCMCVCCFLVCLRLSVRSNSCVKMVLCCLCFFACLVSLLVCLIGCFFVYWITYLVVLPRLEYAFKRGVSYVIEQPSSSLMFEFPPLKRLLQKHGAKKVVEALVAMMVQRTNNVLLVTTSCVSVYVMRLVCYRFGFRY